MIQKDQNTRDHSTSTIGNGDPMHEVCILARGNSKVEMRGRSRHKNDSNRVV